MPTIDISLPSNFYNKRPAGAAIDTIVIHSMHNPDAFERFGLLACKNRLDSFGVSAHYMIDQDGIVASIVEEEMRAWHAGESRMPFAGDQRTAVNDFSIGIELIGSEETMITSAQYASLELLSGDIIGRRAIHAVVGHSDIAPERKTDPWNFDWPRFEQALTNLPNLRTRPQFYSRSETPA